MHLSDLPPEIWIQIIETTTFVAGELDPRVYDPFRCPIQSEIQYRIHENMPTRMALALVSKFFNTIVIRRLYQSIRLVNWASFLRLAETLAQSFAQRNNFDDGAPPNPSFGELVLRVDVVTSAWLDAAELSYDVESFYTLIPNLQVYAVHADYWGIFSPLNPHFDLHVQPFEPRSEKHPRRAPNLRCIYTPIQANYATLQPSSCFIAAHPNLLVYYQESATDIGTVYQCIESGHWGLETKPTFPQVKSIVSSGWNIREYRTFPNLEAITLGPTIILPTIKFLSLHSEHLTTLDISSILPQTENTTEWELFQQLPKLQTLIMTLAIPLFPFIGKHAHPRVRNVFLVLPPVLYKASPLNLERKIPVSCMDQAVQVLPEFFPSMRVVRFWNQFLAVESARCAEKWVLELRDRGVSLESFDGQCILEYLDVTNAYGTSERDP